MSSPAAPEAPPSPSDQRSRARRTPRAGSKHGSWPRRLAALAVVTAVGLWQPYLAGTLAVLLVLIVAHEAGHYLAARRCGMSAPAFSVGFGPVLWGRTIGTTTWSVRAFPVGGSVRILGMHDNEQVDSADEATTYRAQRAWKRVAVSAAGPGANLLCAAALLTVLYAGWGRSTETMQVELVQRSSPAQLAGIRPGDELLAIDGVDVTTMPALRQVLSSSRGDVTLTVERDGLSRNLVLVPAEETGRRVLGVATDKVYRPLAIPDAAAQAGSDLVTGTWSTFGRLADTVRSFGSYLIAPLTGDAPGGDRMVSAVGIANVAEQVRLDVPWLLSMAASINISLAAFNLLPVPPLDGGHIAVATIEATLSSTRRRRIRLDHRALLAIGLVTWGVAMLLGLSALWLDLGIGN